MKAGHKSGKYLIFPLLVNVFVDINSAIYLRVYEDWHSLARPLLKTAWKQQIRVIQ